ncbi:MAG: glycosyltransferase [Dorea sp.]|nr:glycosyltransferase [Dorea sp.]
MKWVIKAGFPDAPVKKWWSEYTFSRSLKKYLKRPGHDVVVEAYDEWQNTKDADVVVVLRGNREYFPDRTLDRCIYIMWNLSHPGQISDEEYNAYDLVCIGSAPYLEKMRGRIHVPAVVLPMCADTEIFYPDSTPCGEKKYDWIFVGNSRFVKRKSVTWSIEHGIPLKIWGANWEGFIPDNSEYVEADNIPNDDLPELYRNARVTVDDHYEDMIENGFINTRIVEALACGLPVISDDSEVLREMFQGAVLCYRDEAEFLEQTQRIEKEYDEIKEKVLSLWPLIREKYSFEACAARLQELADEIRKHREDCAWLVRSLESGIRMENISFTVYTPDCGWQRETEGKPGKQPVPSDSPLLPRQNLPRQKQPERKSGIPRVSVIVSVYNSQEYLDACLQSILSQTLKEIEVICADDLSDDASLAILQRYASEDSRVSLYAVENKRDVFRRNGPSITRNKGMEAAQGEYIYFMDSDDFLDPHALKSLYKRSREERLDILYFNGETVFDSPEDKEQSPGFADYYIRKKNYPGLCTGEEMFVKMRRAGEYRSSVVMQFFNRDFLKRAGLSFCPGVLHEDNEFSFRAALLAERTGYLAENYYKRRIHKASIMTGKRGVGHVYGYFRALTGMWAFGESYECEEQTQEMIYDLLEGILYNLRKEYRMLTWQERQAFSNLKGSAKQRFQLCVQSERKSGRRDRDEARRLQAELNKVKGQLNHTKMQLDKTRAEKAELHGKLHRTYREKSEINRKLQITYGEKSEINRKLQVTYGEKYDRGLRIKSLEKELASIKGSRSYRLARVMGFPVRFFRRMMKRIK